MSQQAGRDGVDTTIPALTANRDVDPIDGFRFVHETHTGRHFPNPIDYVRAS